MSGLDEIWTLKLRHRFPVTWLPYRIRCPWQPVVAEDGPYKAWRFRGREWFKRPWPEGRTREKYEEYARRSR